MTTFLLSPAAQADLDEIWDFTADTWNVEQADRYTALIVRACAAISPDGREGRPIPEIRAGYRKISLGSHFIVFRLVDGQVDVVRILHQRMDVHSHLQD